MGRWLLPFVVLSGCIADGDGGSAVNACAIAGDEQWSAVDELLADEPVCKTDSDCVSLDVSVRCEHASATSCGVIMHRTAATRWDPAAVCAAVDRQTKHSKLSCDISASCADEGAPVCHAGQCVGKATLLEADQTP